METQFSRTEMLFGREAMARLRESKVAVFGIGGVGGYAVEALARSGIGALDLIDDDKVCLSNLNRQIIATHLTLGAYKVDVAADRILDINPEAKVRTYKVFYTPKTAALFDFSIYDYIIDAIDTVTGKIALVVNAHQAGTPIISAMGAGNKMDPTALEVADIYDTSVCPLAKVMRRELRRRGIPNLKVVYSKEVPLKPIEYAQTEENQEEEADTGKDPDAAKGKSSRRQVPGSNAFVPAAAGLILAGEVIKDLIREREYGSDVTERNQ